jgi:hypothetical protein
LIYEWKLPGIFRIPAQVAGEEIEKCTDKYGLITPQGILSKAKDPSNPLHQCFEWDDKKAATKYRLNQASQMLRYIVREPENDQEEIRIRAFVNIVDQENRGYKTITAISEVEFDYVLRCALKELQDFRKKYNQLKELAFVFKAIDETLEESEKVAI